MKLFLLASACVVGILTSFHVLADPYTPTTPKDPTPSVGVEQVKRASEKKTDTKRLEKQPTPSSELKRAVTPMEVIADSEALPIDSNWKARAAQWFATTDKVARRKEMRKIVKALKQPCRYCHSTDFKSFTAHLKVSRQMMDLSAEHGVECSDCHAGKTEYTQMGKIAADMWKLAREKKVFCGHCHVKGSKFAHLTAAGQAHKESK